MNVCPHCGKEFPPSVLYCPNDGHALMSMVGGGAGQNASQVQAQSPPAQPPPRRSAIWIAVAIVGAMILGAGGFVAGNVFSDKRTLVPTPTPPPAPTPAPEEAKPAIAVTETPPPPDAEIDPQPVDRPRKRPMLRVISIPPNASVYIGTRRLGKTPLSIPAGRAQKLTLKKKTYYRLILEVSKGQRSPLKAKLQQIPLHLRARTFSALKDYHRRGKISRTERNMGERALKNERDRRRDALKVKYKKGLISRSELKRQEKMIINSYL